MYISFTSFTQTFFFQRNLIFQLLNRLGTIRTYSKDGVEFIVDIALYSFHEAVVMRHGIATKLKIKKNMTADLAK